VNGAKDLQSYTVAVRAYAAKAEGKDSAKGRGQNPSIGHSEWALIFDTETTTDAAQKLRFGNYQVLKHGELVEKGFFYKPEALTDGEISVLQNYADSQGFALLTADEFIEEVFFFYADKLSALCIGFNLPFDLSRLAIRHTTAKNLRGGFSFILSESVYKPRVQIKRLNNRASLIRFTVPAEQRSSRSSRKRNDKNSSHRGYFLDVKTLASALLSGSWSLKSLADHLKTDSRKIDTDEHGASLTPEYLDYAARDVQVTWECFEKLRVQYESYGLRHTPVNRIYSEASRGKANFQEMEIKGWRELQPEFPLELTGAIMSAYYGGRAEVHIRRQIARVLYCDFLSMYPTVCTKMGLWRFVVAEKTLWEDYTAETQNFLESVRLEDLQKQETWAQLATIVQIQPMDDVLPVRAKYDGKQYSIGLNYLTGDSPIWYTLADCIASKLLTRRAPRVIQAIRFRPQGVQKGLRPINIAGNPAYRIDPYKDDFYRQLIELRNEVKAKIKECKSDEKEHLEADQLALKILANATSYGIFVEFKEGDSSERQKVTVYGQAEKPFTTSVMRTEEPGQYFHPLIATLITGAARLMLAIAERLAQDSGITWAFCDTDSMALAQPYDVKMSDSEFIKRAKKVQEWFSPLSPYKGNEPLFKIEDVNYKLSGRKGSKKIEKLFCFAVSAKRYALFNIDDSNRPIIRKASAHGLGHLLPPYEEKDAPANIPKPVEALSKIGVARWQHDFWYQILTSALNGHPERVNFAALSNFNNVAVSRYAATSPDLLRWFKTYNANREYSEQVKPFNFLLSFHQKPAKVHLSPIAPFDKDHNRAVKLCFDRNTREPIPPECLRTYREVLAQYHLHPEAKFDNGDYTDIGVTRRKHIYASGIEYIGKEANRLEDQWYLGHDPEAQTVYRLPKKDFEKLAAVTICEARKYSQRELARASGYSLREVSRLICGEVAATPQSIARFQSAINALEKEKQEAAETLSRARQAIQKNKIGLRKFAAQAGIDPTNLYKTLMGKRRPSAETITKLQHILSKSD
jgi:transcriptional regulator with XRE-family HTH domain